MLAALLATIALGSGIATSTARVAYVSDGDTIYVQTDSGRTVVRLIGIDAPEIRHGARAGECGGPEATEALRARLPRGTRVTLVGDPAQDPTDRYGRALAYVFAPGRRGPTGSVNYAMVAEGLARAYVYDRRRPFRHAARYLAAEQRSRGAARGLWGRCNT